MQTVVLDTNALLMPFEMKINLDIAIADLLGEVRCIVPAPLIGELKHLDHKFAKVALELAKKYEIIQTTSSGDNAVLEAALMTNGYILTNDKELKRRARSQRVPVIYLRSDTHLVID